MIMDQRGLAAGLPCQLDLRNANGNGQDIRSERKGTAVRRILALAAAAGVAASLAFTAGTANAANPVPLPPPLRNHHFVTEKDAAELYAWGPGENDPGNCVANRKEIHANASSVTLSTTGKSNDCTDIESPHTYPTTNGYVYEADVYFSNFKDWPSFWMYGNNWPSGGEIDAVEALFGANYVTYHYGSISDPKYVSTSNNTIKALSKNIRPGWHIIDISFGACGKGCGAISVWYDGRLYATVSGRFVVNGPHDPYWITFSEGSCSQPKEKVNVCAPGADGVPGYVKVKWLRIFD
jgi:hypothetical protein